MNAFIEIILAIILKSRATATLDAIEFLETFICLSIDAQQSSNATPHALIAVSENNWRTHIGEKYGER
jgi:hypothetical protein